MGVRTWAVHAGCGHQLSSTRCRGVGAGAAVTCAVAAAQPKPQTAQDALGLSVAVHEGCVQFFMAAIHKGAYRRGAGARIHAAPHLHSAQNCGGPERGARGDTGWRRSGHGERTRYGRPGATRTAKSSSAHSSGCCTQHGDCACVPGRLGLRPQRADRAGRRRSADPGGLRTLKLIRLWILFW